MSAVTVRRATLKDLDAMMGLERSAPTAPHWPHKVWKDFFAIASDDFWGNGRGVFVAMTEGMVVGFAVGHCVGFVAELENIVVHEAFRRKGVGKVLYDAITMWASQQGATVLELEVRASNEAIAFYVAQGFAEQSRRKRYYKDPVEDAVLMTGPLP